MSLRRKLLPLLLSLAGVFAVYLPSLRAGFVFDDHHFVERNPCVRSLSAAARSFADPRAQSSVEELSLDVYRPLAALSFAADHALAGLDPAWFRGVNLALHALAAALLYWLAGLAGLAPPWAAAAAAFFALFPAGVEAAAWISARSAVLSAVFMFASLICFLKGAREEWRPGYPLAGLFCAAALLTREVAVVLPLLALGWAAAERRPLRKYLLPAGLWLALPALLFVLLRLLVLGKLQQAAAPALPAAAQLSLPFVLFAKYVELLAWPFSMTVTYTDLVEMRLGALGFYLPFSAAVCLLYAGLAWALRERGEGAAAWGLLWAPLCLLPVLNLVPLTVYMAERFLYLPAAGAGLALAAGAARLARGGRARGAAFAAFGLLLLLFSGEVRRRIPVWSSDVALWTYDAAGNPGNFLSRLRLADAQRAAGDPAAAEKNYRLALGLASTFGQLSMGFNELGTLYAAGGDLDKAEKVFSQAARCNPSSHLALYNLGKLRYLKGDRRGAKSYLERSLALKAGYEPARLLLALVAG